MYRSIYATAVFVLLLASMPRLDAQKRPAPKAAKTPASAKEQDREGIEALQKREIAASIAFDVSALLDLWTDDGVLLPPRHEPIVGKAALRRFFQEQKDKYANYEMLAYDEQWNEVMVVGEYAYQWGTVSYRMKPPTGGEFGGAVHAVRILKREEDGYWRVARAMWNEGLATTQ